MKVEPPCLSRRRWLAGFATCSAWALQPTAHAHQSPGSVTPPRLVPDLTLTGADAQALSLKRALLGHVTAMQLMFTGCSATCPIDVDRLQDFVRGRSIGVGRHTPQVCIFNRRAELVLRTLDLPPGEQIVDVLRQVGRFVWARRRSRSPNSRMTTSPRSRAPDICPCIGERSARRDLQGPARTMRGHDFTQYPSQHDRLGTGLVCGLPPLPALIAMSLAIPARGVCK